MRLDQKKVTLQMFSSPPSTPPIFIYIPHPPSSPLSFFPITKVHSHPLSLSPTLALCLSHPLSLSPPLALSLSCPCPKQIYDGNGGEMIIMGLLEKCKVKVTLTHTHHPGPPLLSSILPSATISAGPCGTPVPQIICILSFL